MHSQKVRWPNSIRGSIPLRPAQGGESFDVAQDPEVLEGLSRTAHHERNIRHLVLGLISTVTYNTTPLEKSFLEKIPPPPL